MPENKRFLTLTDANFEPDVLKSSTPVLVDFWADWCAPCHVIAPILAELATELEGAIKVGKVNVDEQRDLMARYDVRSIPTLLFFRNGEVVDRVIGAAPRAVLAEKLAALAEAA